MQSQEIQVRDHVTNSHYGKGKCGGKPHYSKYTMQTHNANTMQTQRVQRGGCGKAMAGSDLVECRDEGGTRAKMTLDTGGIMTHFKKGVD